MIVFLMGQPGAGKNYVGEILAAQFGFHFWDADLALTDDMQLAIKNKQVFTQDMRDSYIEKIIENVRLLSAKFDNLVVAQALFKEKNRQQLASAFSKALFVLVQANSDQIIARLRLRNNAVDNDYADKVRLEFETPLLPHKVIINDSDAVRVKEQLQLILPCIKHDKSSA
jgi:gluconate kinase